MQRDTQAWEMQRVKTKRVEFIQSIQSILNFKEASTNAMKLLDSLIWDFFSDAFWVLNFLIICLQEH